MAEYFFDKAESIRKEMERATKQTESLEDSIRSIGSNAGRTDKILRHNINSWKEAARAMEKHAPISSKFVSSIAQIGNDVEELNRRFSRMHPTIAGLTKAAITAETAIFGVHGAASHFTKAFKVGMLGMMNNGRDAAVTAVRGSSLVRLSGVQMRSFIDDTIVASKRIQQVTGETSEEATKRILGLMSTIATLNNIGDGTVNVEEIAMSTAKASVYLKLSADESKSMSDTLLRTFRILPRDIVKTYDALGSNLATYGTAAQDQVQALQSYRDLVYGLDPSEREQFAKDIMKSASIYKAAGVDFERNVKRMTGPDALEQMATLAALSNRSTAEVATAQMMQRAGDPLALQQIQAEAATNTSVMASGLSPEQYKATQAEMKKAQMEAEAMGLRGAEAAQYVNQKVPNASKVAISAYESEYALRQVGLGGSMDDVAARNMEIKNLKDTSYIAPQKPPEDVDRAFLTLDERTNQLTATIDLWEIAILEAAGITSETVANIASHGQAVVYAIESVVAPIREVVEGLGELLGMFGILKGLLGGKGGGLGGFLGGLGAGGLGMGLAGFLGKAGVKAAGLGTAIFGPQLLESAWGRDGSYLNEAGHNLADTGMRIGGGYATAGVPGAIAGGVYDIGVKGYEGYKTNKESRDYHKAMGDSFGGFFGPLKDMAIGVGLMKPEQIVPDEVMKRGEEANLRLKTMERPNMDSNINKAADPIHFGPVTPNSTMEMRRSEKVQDKADEKETASELGEKIAEAYERVAGKGQRLANDQTSILRLILDEVSTNAQDMLWMRNL